MEILVTAPYVPWPLHGGTPIRMFNLLREVRRQGHTITLLAGSSGPAAAAELPEDHREALSEVCDDLNLFPTEGGSGIHQALSSVVSQAPYPFPRFLTNGYEDAVRLTLKDRSFDLAFINFLFMAKPILEHAQPGMPVVVDQHEVERLVWQDYLRDGQIHERAFALLNLLKLRFAEPKLLDNIDALVSVSEQEAELTRAQAPGDLDVWVAPNGVDLGFYDPEPAGNRDDKRILFVATLSVNRNARAALWFANQVFPRIREEVPDATFQIVGANPVDDIRTLDARPGVDVTGTVEDVRPYYRNARLVVAPFHFGAGTKLKVLEALAMGRPVVSTPNGAQGIGIEDGSHALLAEEPEAFCESVVRLLRHPSEAEKIGQGGRSLVEKTFTWPKIGAALDHRLRGLVR